jgi:2-polyprenyl-3-methyl-5-hydroxy-6-metoxy-1,4-benzoquinol methylase
MADPNQPRSELPPIEEQRRFWNRWNAQFREETGADLISQARAEKIAEILRALNLNKPEIVDIGCGTGWLSEQLSAFGSVTGIDLADEVIRRAQDRSPAATFLAGDFLTMGLPAAHYDVAVSVSTLSHVTDQRAFVERVAYLLKPRGHFILATQNRFVLKRSETVRQIEPGQIRKWLSITEVKRLLSTHFDVVSVTTIFPTGHKGLLRVVNSYKLSEVSERLLGRAKLDTLKERLGLGQTIIVLGRKV